uniref:Uncharacterized protein n=1 Tax=Oncorhynchus tshawytscha TaxID=74940 RepID=A0A8C8M1V3_ONCTS
MIDQQKLLLLWAWMLLVAALCPGALCKRGGGFRGWGQGTGVCVTPPSQSHGSSRQGLKMAGAAAARALGGADQRFHYPEGQGLHNQSDWCRYRSAAGPGPGPMSSILLTLGSMVPFFLGDWIRGI